ncbi:hypothetical protein D3C77_421340 [compost metagenome]
MHHDTGIQRFHPDLNIAKIDAGAAEPAGRGLGQGRIDGIDALLPIALEFTGIGSRLSGIGLEQRLLRIVQYLGPVGNYAGFKPGQLRGLRHGDLQFAFLHRGAQGNGVARGDRLIEQGGWGRGEDIRSRCLAHVGATIEQGCRRKCGEHRRVVIGVPVACRHPLAEQPFLAVGILHHCIPALMTGGAGNIEWQRMTIRGGEGLGVPLGYGQGHARHLPCCEPVDHVVAGQRVFLQLADAAIAVHIDYVAGGKGRQRAQAIASPGTGGGDGHLHPQCAQVGDHIDVETALQIVEKQLRRTMLPGAPGLVGRQVVTQGKCLGFIHVQAAVLGYILVR